MAPQSTQQAGEQARQLFPQTARGWAWLAAKLLLSLAVLAAAFSQIDLRALAATPQRIDYALAALGVLVLFASIVTAAVRWSFLTRPYAPLGLREANAITFAAQFVGQVLPSSLGQDAVRAWLAIRENRNTADTVSIILLDRLCGLIGLSLLIFAGLPRLAELGGVAHGRQAAVIAGSFAGAAAVGALVARFIPAPKALPALVRKLWEAARHAAQLLTSAKGLIAVVVSIGGQALVTLSMWLLARSLGAPLSLLDGFATIPAAMFVALMPISMNGWGVREGAMVVSLGFAGVNASIAFIVSVLFGVALLFTSLPGLLALIALRRRP